MSLHDLYARRTPFELAFPDAAEAEALFVRVAEEAGARGADTGNPHQFAMLGAVGAFIRELRGTEGSAAAVHEYGALAYHAFHFAAAGRRVDLVSAEAARALVEATDMGGDPVAPGRAGYLQLPQHLFWTSITPGEPPQSVDGFFWNLDDDFLRVLMALGLRPDQGLLVVPLPEAPWADRDAWVDADMREGGADFTSSLPGAELDGLYSLESAGEVLKFLVRVFIQIGRVEGEEESPPSDATTPLPSSLPYFRVRPDG
jgi:hypothetical protein